MPSSTLSDPLLQVALWTGIVALAATLVMAVLIVVLRRRMVRQRHAWSRFVETWRPVLMGVILDDADATPRPALRPADREDLLRLWIYLHESVRGEGQERLRQFALDLGLDAMVRQRLDARSRTARLQAVLAAGLLRDMQAWQALVRLARGADSALAAFAARAMVRIDADYAREEVLPLVLRRRDWDPTQAAAIVGQAGAAWHEALREALQSMPLVRLPRVLTWIAALAVPLPDALVRHWLVPDMPPPVLRAALPLAGSPDLAEAVRPLLAHPDMGVRALAAERMASLASLEDVPLLTRALDDPHEPVRLAAGRALSLLPFLDRQSLATLAAPGTPGAEALRQTLAERAWA